MKSFQLWYEGEALTEIPFAGESYPTRSFDEGNVRTINWYPFLDKNVQLDMGKNSDGKPFLYPAAGSTLVFDSGGSSCRAAFAEGPEGWAIIDDIFYTVDIAGNFVSRGRLETSNGFCTIANNPYQVGVCDGYAGYVYDKDAKTFKVLNTANFPGAAGFPPQPTYMCFKDDFNIVTSDPYFYVCDAGDITTWDPLLFTAADSTASRLKAVVGFGDNLYLFKDASLEVWMNNTSAPSSTVGSQFFPFIRREGSTMHYGCQFPATIVKTSTALLFLASTTGGGPCPIHAELSPYTLRASQVTPMFNEGIRDEIGRLSYINDAYAFTYNESGDEFYVLTFPTARKTYVLNLRTQLAYERSSIIDQQNQAWYPSCAMTINNTVYLGSRDTGAFYKLDKTTGMERGVPILRTRRTIPYSQENKYLSAYSLTVLFEAGAALPTGQGSNPQAMLRVSHDGGHTFDMEQWAAIGMEGEFQDLAIYRMLGMARKWCFELVVSDPIPWIVRGLEVDFSVGTN